MNTRLRIERLGREIEEKMLSLHAFVSKLAPENTESTAVELNCGHGRKRWMIAFHQFNGLFYQGYEDGDVLTVLDDGIANGLHFPEGYRTPSEVTE